MWLILPQVCVTCHHCYCAVSNTPNILLFFPGGRAIILVGKTSHFLNIVNVQTRNVYSLGMCKCKLMFHIRMFSVKCIDVYYTIRKVIEVFVKSKQ